MMRHPARLMQFDALYEGLQAAWRAGLAYRRDCAATGRVLYVYSNSCVYNNGWDEFTLLARGLVLHPARKQVVATPFPKFFNAGERGAPIPDLPFEVFEKVDGSLAIIHHFDGAWRVATKGAFESPQAGWAQRYLQGSNLAQLDIETTYLAEAIYPENRIVVRYAKPELVLLSAYRPDGTELSFAELQDVGASTGWRVALRHDFTSFSDLVTHARALPRSQEGYVIRFANGHRLKLKGDEYTRIHALISRCTPLAMWEALLAGDDMKSIRRDLPEEFWADFDAITAILTGRIAEINDKLVKTAAECIALSDKEVGLKLQTLDPDVRPFIFHWRKLGGKLEGRVRDTLFRHIRPTGNELAGYTPSHAINRVIQDIG